MAKTDFGLLRKSALGKGRHATFATRKFIDESLSVEVTPKANDLMGRVEFIACNDADRVERSINPLTGGPFILLGGIVSDAERKSIHEVLNSVDALSVGDEDAFAARFADGGSAEIWFAGYHENEIRCGAITIEQLSHEVSAWIYTLLQSGNLAITPSDANVSPVVCSKHSAQAIAHRWPDAPMVNSPAEMHQLLTVMTKEESQKRRPWWRF